METTTPIIKSGAYACVPEQPSNTDGYIGTIEGGKDLSADSFFTQAPYKGAVSADNDWTAGWVKR